MVNPITIRIVITLAVICDWTIKQLDVNNTFFNGDLEDDVYITQLEGFVDANFPFMCVN